MFDIGWTEMVVVVVLAIIVIGPKDLPKLIRTIGQWTARARSLAREFQNSIDDIAREAEIDEIKKSVETATNFDIKKEIENSIEATGGPDGAKGPTAPTNLIGDGSENAQTGEPEDPMIEPEAMQAELDAKQAEWAVAAAPPHSIVPPEDPFADDAPADGDPATDDEPAGAPPKVADDEPGGARPKVADDESEAGGAAVKTGVGG